MQAWRWCCSKCRGVELVSQQDAHCCPRCGTTWSCRHGIWRDGREFEPAGFSASRQEHLTWLEQSHFWFAPRDQLLRRRLTLLSPGATAHLIDLGCGSGRFLRACRDVWPVRVGVDGHQHFLAQAAAQDPKGTWIHADLQHIPLLDGQFQMAVALDVLEHLDPEPFLREAYRLVRPGGWLLLSVPAFPWLWSRVDQAAGHRCRYRVADLRRELEQTGWCWAGHTHYQFILLPLVMARRWGKQPEIPTLERNPPPWLNRILGAINRWEVGFLEKWSLPWGSSLVAWARRPAR